MVIKVRVVL